MIREAAGRARRRTADTALARLAPAERRALGAVAAAWLIGVVAGALDLDARLAAWTARRLDPPLPNVEELAARLPPGDPRVEWYAAGLVLAEERTRAASAPAPLDPNTADRADWDRLPGIGPRTAEAIIAARAALGGFRGPDDLLAVPRVGPRTLERLAPYLAWPASGDGRPDLNTMDEARIAAIAGIGPKLASTIIRERRRTGGFRAWSELDAIDGIGAARLSALQEATRLVELRPAAEHNKKE